MAVGRRRVAQPCGACDKRRTRYVCSRCQQQRYCSRDCQKQDWAKHKTTCKSSLPQLPSLGLPDGEPRREEDIKRLYQKNIENLLKATAALRGDMRGPELLPPPRRAAAMAPAKNLRKELEQTRELADRAALHAAQEQKPRVPPRPRNASALLEGQPPVPPRSSAAKELALAAREGLQGKEMSFLSALVGSDEPRADGGAAVDVRRTEELEKLVSATQIANTRRLAKMRPASPTGVEDCSSAWARASAEAEQARVETTVAYGSLTASHVIPQIANGSVSEKSDREMWETRDSWPGEEDEVLIDGDGPKAVRETLAGDISGDEVMAAAKQLSPGLPPHEVTADEESGEDRITDAVDAVADEEESHEEERKDEEEAGAASTFYETIPVERLVFAEDDDEDNSETMEEDDIAIIYEMPFFDEERSRVDVVEATISPELRAPIPDARATASAVDFYRQQYQQSSSSVSSKSDVQLRSSAFATPVSPRSSESAPGMANRFNVSLGGDGPSQLESVSNSSSDPLRRTLPGRSAATKEERKKRRRSVLSKFSFSFDGKSKTKRDKSVKKELRKTRKSRQTVRKEASQQPLPDLAVVAEVPLPEPRAGQPTKRQFSQWLLQFGDQPIQNVMNARHCDWLIGWVKNKTADRRLVHQAAKFLCSLAYPDELVPGLQQLVTRKKAAPALMLLAQQGVVAVHREVAKEEVAVLETIARGAEGVIKMAQFSGKEEKVVVKVCSEENINFDIENFRLEAALMSMLKHEHICPCFGASFKGPDYFVILPHMARGSLDSVLLDESQELDMLAKVKIATKIAKGMAYIHQGEIMHRDLKSANVLLGKHMEVKIIDFGSSVVLLKRGQNLQRNMGTTAWIAPEVFVSSQYSKSADVYSFGIVLWEIVMRRCQPYEGVCKIFDLPTAVPAGVRPPLPELGACPAAITALMQQCWHANPSARPSFTEVTRRLYDVYKTLFIARGKGDSAPLG